MADNRWQPKALATAQVDTVTVANTWTAADTVTLTINGKALVVTIGSLVTTAQVATTIKQAWENESFTDTTASKTPANGGQDIVEHSEITATVSGSVVTLTHDIRGRPFTLSVTESTAGDGTATEATATPATGPNHVNNVLNWSAGTNPTTGEDVYIDDTDVSLLYALDSLNDTVATLTIGANFTGDIGLPKNNPSGYLEYLPDYFDMPATIVFIGTDEGQGSGRIKLDNQAVPCTWNVEKTGSSSEFGLPAVILKGTDSGNVLDVNGGEVGVCVYGAETANIATARIAAGKVTFGEGAVVGTLNVLGGEVDLRRNLTTLAQGGGSVTCWQSMTIGTATVTGGTLNYRSSGTITTLSIGGLTGPVLDCSGDASGRTISTLSVTAPSEIFDPFRTITYTTLVVGANVDRITIT